MGVNIPHEMVGSILVVTPQGEYLDASNTKDFKREMAPLLENHPKMVMDLRRVQLVDSSGCGAFISFLRQLKAQGGDMKLCGVTRPVRSLFELVRMHRIFDIFNTREEALKAFEV
jgi:anti-sigma B factor antagonist